MLTYVFDTNALVYASQLGISITSKRHHISIISELELLSFAQLSLEDEAHLHQVLAQFNIHTITQHVKLDTIKLRKTKNLKLPDSIILATAQVLDCPLITNDKQILKVAGNMAVSFDKVAMDNL